MNKNIKKLESGFEMIAVSKSIQDRDRDRDELLPFTMTVPGIHVQCCMQREQTDANIGII